MSDWLRGLFGLDVLTVTKANPYHEPAGTSAGGQFASKPGGSGAGDDEGVFGDTQSADFPYISDPSERQARLAEEAYKIYEKRTAWVKSVSDNFGIEPHKVYVSSFNKRSDIDSERLAYTAGQYSREDDRIILFPAAFSSRAEAYGILAHETQHRKLLKVMQADSTRAGVLNPNSRLILNGDIAPGGEWVDWAFSGAGISKYAGLHWFLASHPTGGSQRHLISRAVNETLSEIESIKHTSPEKYKRLPKNWLALHQEVNRAYAKHK